MAGRSILILSCAVALGALLLAISRTGNAPEAEIVRLQGKNNTVLVLTNQERGLSNVLLATCQALSEQPGVDVHYASFPGLAKVVEEISDSTMRRNPAATRIRFHAIKGHTYTESLELDAGLDQTSQIMRPGFSGLKAFLPNFPTLISPWEPKEHLEIIYDIQRIIDDVNPAVVAVDPLFPPGVDAAANSNRTWAVISPNLLADSFGAWQPAAAVLWKYPVLLSGHTFPVPWYLRPANVFYNFWIFYHIVTSQRLAQRKQFLSDRGIAAKKSIVELYQPDVPWLTPTLAEADYPLPVIPPNVTSHGPILLASAPAEEQDPELTRWLRRAPTVLINLGSMVRYDEKGAEEMVRAMKTVLDQTDVQFLWKFKKRGDFSDAFLSNLTAEIANERVKLVDWLKVDPPALLQTGHIAAMVHHGGAGSFAEAIASGVPQVALPLWADCFHYAARIEYLGIGVWGNREGDLYWEAEQMSEAFMKILRDDEAARSIKAKANALGQIAQRNPGRLGAATRIAELARQP